MSRNRCSKRYDTSIKGYIHIHSSSRISPSTLSSTISSTDQQTLQSRCQGACRVEQKSMGIGLYGLVEFGDLVRLEKCLVSYFGCSRQNFVGCCTLEVNSK